MTIQVKNGLDNVFVSELNSKIMLSIYSSSGSMNTVLTTDKIKELIQALKTTLETVPEKETA